MSKHLATALCAAALAAAPLTAPPLAAPPLAAAASPQEPVRAAANEPLLMAPVAIWQDSAGKDARFDLAREQLRLRVWLARDDHRARVLADPGAMSQFNGSTEEQGGPLSGELCWLPYVIERDRRGVARFTFSWTVGQPDKAPVVPLFEEGAYERGPTDDRPRLIELLPIRIVPGDFFTWRDLDLARLRVDEGAYGEPAVSYRVTAARAGVYAEWTEKLTRRNVAICTDGRILAAPEIMSRIVGAGQITGTFTRRWVKAFVERLRRATDPGRGDRPAADEPPPERSAETDEVRALVAADRSVRALGERADTPPGSRLVGFDLLAGCPVTTDVHDLPADVLGLRDRDVTMFGMVVPLRAVEGMREFLLVRSLWSAAFADAPAMNEVVRVRLRDGSTADYTDLKLHPVRVTGRFAIAPAAEQGICTGMFELRDAVIEVAR